MRIPPVELKHYGNILKIIISIPWEDVRLPEPQKPIDKPGPEVWANLTQTIMSAYQELGSISKAAKATKKTYYIAHEIIRSELAKERRSKRQAVKDEAIARAQSGESIRSVANFAKRSERTIHRWMAE